jgi:hypothetical protein
MEKKIFQEQLSLEKKIIIMEVKVNKMAEYKDLAVEGAAIEARPKQEWFADIIAPEPRYEDVPSLEDPSKTKEKLIMNVKIAGKDLAEYYPNKTSSRFIANTIGTRMEGWIGARIFWRINDQKVAGQDKKVLYVEKVERTPKPEKKE